jgi:hypothetical protein
MRIDPALRSLKRPRLQAAIDRYGEGLFGRYTVIEEARFRSRPAKRWELIKAMAGQGPLTIRAAARRVSRDVKAVHGDVHALLNAGLLDKTEDGRIVFPFGAVRVDFTLHAA